MNEIGYYDEFKKHGGNAVVSVLGVALYIGTFVILIFTFRDLVQHLCEDNFKITFTTFIDVLLIYVCLSNFII